MEHEDDHRDGLDRRGAFGLAMAWSYTSLSDFADAGRMSTLLSAYSQSVWGPPFAIAAFVVGGLVVFPVLVLIAATAAALGPWLGFVTAMTGSCSAPLSCLRSDGHSGANASSVCSDDVPRASRNVLSARDSGCRRHPDDPDRAVLSGECRGWREHAASA